MKVVSLSTDLIEIPEFAPVMLFTEKGMTPVLEQIEAKVAEFKPDLSTATSRKEIASMAAKVSRSKTLLDDVGKKLTEDARKQIKAVDGIRKHMRDRLDNLRDQTRQPLNEWEAKDQLRIDEHQANLAELTALTKIEDDATSGQIKMRITMLGKIAVDDQWQEFKDEAEAIKSNGLASLDLKFRMTLQREEQAKRLAILEAEKAERDAKEAADKKAQEEQQRKDREELEKLRKEAAEAQAAKLKAEQDAADQKRRADDAEKKAIEQMKIDAERAEKQKAIEAKAKADAEAREKAAKEKEQETILAKDKLHNRIREILMANAGITEDQACCVLACIIDGDLPYVRIEY